MFWFLSLQHQCDAAAGFIFRKNFAGIFRPEAGLRNLAHLSQLEGSATREGDGHDHDNLRAMTPFGGLSAFTEFLGRIGLVEQLANRCEQSLPKP